VYAHMYGWLVLQLPHTQTHRHMHCLDQYADAGRFRVRKEKFSCKRVKCMGGGREGRL